MTTTLTQHWRLQFENKYLGAWNLEKDGRYITVKVKIGRIVTDMITMQKGRKEQAVLMYFLRASGAESPTPLILTKTMGKVMQAMYGRHPQAWIGKEITLYVEEGVRVQGGVADVLRIKNTRAGRDTQEAVRAAAPVERFEDEEVKGDGDDASSK